MRGSKIWSLHVPYNINAKFSSKKPFGEKEFVMLQASLASKRSSRSFSKIDISDCWKKSKDWRSFSPSILIKTVLHGITENSSLNPNIVNFWTVAWSGLSRLWTCDSSCIHCRLYTTLFNETFLFFDRRQRGVVSKLSCILSVLSPENWPFFHLWRCLWLFWGAVSVEICLWVGSPHGRFGKVHFQTALNFFCVVVVTHL